MNNLIETWLGNNLLKVVKPGRYVGGEYNQIKKIWGDHEIHVALAFPDIYDLGVSNLGLTILYDAINKRSDALAERAYSPWTDMESIMRKDGIPLFSLESKFPLKAFDILGISLPYETVYTNTLNLLDLAQIPIISSKRTHTHPLVIAGGHATYNPEPMSKFIDAFALGEGEEIIHEIINVFKMWKTGNCESRDKLLEMLTSVPGLYIPKYYKPVYHPNGKIASIECHSPNAQNKVTKRIVGKLPPPPTKLLVPIIDVVQNRIAIEIMRGCTRGCRFCHAGMVNRPVRERPVKEIIEAIDQALLQTGYEEIALLSLSSSDYTHINELICEISNKFSDRNLRVSLPSLRIDTFSVELMENIKGTRPGGFTLAPEAATERMRSTINKPLSENQLLETAREVYNRGWLTLKLYFMIGHPSETMDDVRAIADLCKAVRDVGFKTIGRRAKLNVGVSTFVPKPHTPFQWASSDTIENITAKQNLLRSKLRGPGLKMSWTSPEDTMLESLLSRGDRKLCEVIYTAWENGAKFDAWQEHSNFQIWLHALEKHNLDLDFYTERQRDLDEVFAWDHIDIGVRNDYLKKEYENSLTGQIRDDCRNQCYACGILRTFNEEREINPGSLWKCPEVQPR